MIEVLVNDEKGGGYGLNHKYFAEIDRWAREHCQSYAGYHVQDVQDVSYLWDEIAAYLFSDEKDVILFRLKWL